jgi:hypothetical protein
VFKTPIHLIAQLYGLPHGILRVFNTILYENEFQNPQMFQQTISLFPEHSTLICKIWISLKRFGRFISMVRSSSIFEQLSIIIYVWNDALLPGDKN